MSDRLRARSRLRVPGTRSWLDEPVAGIARAVAATEAAHTACVEFVQGFDMSALSWLHSLGLHGTVGRRFTRGIGGSLPAGDRAEGVVDFDRRLVAMDFGFYAEFVDAGREWRGRPGRLRSTLPERPAGWAQPLWLLDLLLGAVAAVPAGEEAVRGEPCVRFAGRADLRRAARESGRGMAVPGVGRVQDLAAIPIDCWIDAGRLVRRVRAEIDGTPYSVDLFDFGVWVDREWPDMPTFRSPAYDDG